MWPTSARRSLTVSAAVGHTCGSSGRWPAFGASQTFATETRTVAASGCAGAAAASNNVSASVTSTVQRLKTSRAAADGGTNEDRRPGLPRSTDRRSLGFGSYTRGLPRERERHLPRVHAGRQEARGADDKGPSLQRPGR